jgi:hypothetical protein
MKVYLGVGVYIQVFLISALVRSEQSTSHPYRFTPWEEVPSTYWKGDWMDPRFGHGDMQNLKFLTLPGPELRPFLGRPAHSQTLYRLRYGAFR